MQKCEEAVKSSNEFISKTLAENMFADMPEGERNEKLARSSALLSNAGDGKAHNTHFQIEECRKAGLKVERLEDDQKLQDLVLTIHHCYMHSLSNTPAFKIVENQLGRAMVKLQQFVMQAPMMGTPISEQPKSLNDLPVPVVIPPD